MSAKRKGISQREAMRNRRELRRLRAFVRGIEGTWPTGEDVKYLARFTCTESVVTEARGMAWGAKERVAFLARFDGATSMQLIAIRTPEATP